MTKAQLIKIIEAMEDSARLLANSETENAKMYKGQASAYAQIAIMLQNPKFAKELAEIYEVNI